MFLAAKSAHVGDAKSKTICETVFPEAITRSDHLSRILVSFWRDKKLFLDYETIFNLWYIIIYFLMNVYYLEIGRTGGTRTPNLTFVALDDNPFHHGPKFYLITVDALGTTGICLVPSPQVKLT